MASNERRRGASDPDWEGAAPTVPQDAARSSLQVRGIGRRPSARRSCPALAPGAVSRADAARSKTRPPGRRRGASPRHCSSSASTASASSSWS